MSLSSLLREKDIKQLFSNYVILPKIKFDQNILIEPATKRYSLVGTAFDYMMRFYLEYLNPDSISGTWIAENTVEFLNLIAVNDKQTIDLMTDIIQKTKINKSVYISNGKITEELARNTIQLALIDNIYRTKRLDLLVDFQKSINNVDQSDIKDILKMMSVLDQKKFKAKNICVLNPKFGKVSQLVKGADADLFIDNTLIDVKTSKNLVINRNMINQLIGYYILSKIDKIEDVPDKYAIERIGIYFARFSELYIVPIDEVIDTKKESTFIKEFKKEIKG